MYYWRIWIDKFLYLFQYIVLNIYFRNISIIDEEYGQNNTYPLILVSNHNNHFVDGWLVAITFKRKFYIIMAKSATKHIFWKYFIPLLNIILIDRPIDNKILGKGKIIEVKGNKIKGDKNCKFLSEFKVKQSLLINKYKSIMKIKSIIDDKTILLENNYNDEILDKKYYIIPYIDQSEIYKQVTDILHKNQIVLMFPEGGSYEETNITSIKPGIFFIINEYYKKYNKIPEIKVIGLNYFGGYKFRSKCLSYISKSFKYDEQIIDNLNNSAKKYKTINFLINDLKEKIIDLKINSESMTDVLDLQILNYYYFIEFKSMKNDKVKFWNLKKLSNYFNLTKDLKMKKYFIKIKDFRQKLKNYNIKLDELNSFFQNNNKNILLNLIKFIWLSILFLPIYTIFYPLWYILKNFVNSMRIIEIKNSNRKKFAYDVISSWNILASIFLFSIVFNMIILSLFFIMYGQNCGIMQIMCKLIIYIIYSTIYLYVFLKFQYFIYKIFKNVIIILYYKELKTLYEINISLRKKFQTFYNQEMIFN